MTLKTSVCDEIYYKILRENIAVFLSRVSSKYASSPGVLLDIAPQVHEGARLYFCKEMVIETLDMSKEYMPTYLADLCSQNLFIQSNRFDYVVCTEVLEHTLNPFMAMQEIFRLTKPNGLVFLSTPFNFRIHGPLPDCWRFTEYGLRALYKEFELLELNQIETPGRPLMPIQYTAVLKKTL